MNTTFKEMKTLLCEHGVGVGLRSFGDLLPIGCVLEVPVQGAPSEGERPGGLAHAHSASDMLDRRAQLLLGEAFLREGWAALSGNVQKYPDCALFRRSEGSGVRAAMVGRMSPPLRNKQGC